MGAARRPLIDHSPRQRNSIFLTSPKMSPLLVTLLGSWIANPNAFLKIIFLDSPQDYSVQKSLMPAESSTKKEVNSILQVPWSFEYSVTFISDENYEINRSCISTPRRYSTKRTVATNLRLSLNLREYSEMILGFE